MKKFVCSVCGYVYEGDALPEATSARFARLPLQSSLSRAMRVCHGLPSM